MSGRPFQWGALQGGALQWHAPLPTRGLRDRHFLEQSLSCEGRGAQADGLRGGVVTGVGGEHGLTVVGGERGAQADGLQGGVGLTSQRSSVRNGGHGLPRWLLLPCWKHLPYHVPRSHKLTPRFGHRLLVPRPSLAPSRPSAPLSPWCCTRPVCSIPVHQCSILDTQKTDTD